MSVTKHIPNTITLLNLLTGCIAVYYAFIGQFDTVFLLVIIAAVFDFLDGLAARALHAYSPLGKELDSLADMVSFGVVPGVIAFSLMRAGDMPLWLSFSGFLIPVFSGYRLAKFNIDERQTQSFIGLPTPANALFWIGISTAYAELLTSTTWIIPQLVLIFSILLIAEIPMFSLKFKNFGMAENKTRYIFLVGCIALMIIFGLKSMAFIIAWYILWSLIILLFSKRA